MYLFKMASKWMANASPLGLLLVGTAVVAGVPAIKNVVRGVAVTAAKGVLTIAEGAATLGSDVKEGWEDLVAEAKAQKATAAMAGAGGLDTGTVVGAGAGGAVGASIGGSMAGAMGAAVGAGVGSVVGAGVGSGVSEHHTDPHKPHASTSHDADKDAKKTTK